MSQKRKDNKKRILREGEYQRRDGRYSYRHVDTNGEEKIVYSWRLVESDPHPIGKKKDISLREKELALQKDTMDNILVSGGDVELSKLFKQYMSTKRSINTNTRSNYILLYEKYVEEFLGKRKIKSIKKEDILRLYGRLADQELSNGTIQNIHNDVLFPLFEYAVDNDKIRKNPCKGCLQDFKYDVRNLRESLTVNEQHIYMQWLKNDKVYSKYYRIAGLILGTGMRRGEVLGLTWKDVDFKKKTITVDHQLYYYSVNGKYKFGIDTPKSEDGNRIVPMTDETCELLHEIWANDYFVSAQSDICIDGYTNFIFLNTAKTNPIIPRQLSDSLLAASRKFNKKENHLAEKENREPMLLPDITSHVLRHTACTRMAEAGVDVKVLQSIMGHKSIEITMNIYNHVDLQRLASEAEKIKPVNMQICV